MHGETLKLEYQILFNFSILYF